MHSVTVSAIGAAVVAAVVFVGPSAAAGTRGNPYGWGLHSPDGHGGYRYDKRSWYYLRPGYYPYYNSDYWVPRSEMRYRYRYLYHGPKYRYHPTWGYPRPGHYGSGDGHWGRWNTPLHWNW
jgi:hypothetical protein